MKKLLVIMVLGLLWCNTAFSVESLTEGQKGTIKFESIPVITLNQFLKGETIGDSVQISGKLQFPKKKLLLFCCCLFLFHFCYFYRSCLLNLNMSYEQMILTITDNGFSSQKIYFQSTKSFFI